MSHSLKSVLKKALPTRLSAEIGAYRWWRYLDAHHDHALSRQIIALAGTRVVRGPFQGLIFSPLHAHTSFLLGTYESELHPWFERLFRNTYDRVLDIGAGEGYYAVGMAMRSGTTVDAYDAAPQARRRCRALARLNGCEDRVRIHSWCDGAQLKKLKDLRSLILSDCEGFELNLFTADTIPALEMADLIIELHGDARQTLEERLRKTHHLEVVQLGAREPRQFPYLSFLPEDLARRAIDESLRCCQQEWMLAIAARSIA